MGITWGACFTSSSATEHIEFPHLTLLKTRKKSTMPPKSNNQKKKEAEAAGRAPKKTKRQERQAKEAGNAGKEGRRQGKEVWLVKACCVDGFYARLENGVMLSLFKKTRSAKRFDS